MAKNRIGSCSECNSDLFNEKEPYNTNYWVLNNNKKGKTDFYCDNCWEKGKRKYLKLPDDDILVTQGGLCNHCKDVYVEAISPGNSDCTATKNHHTKHEHNQTACTDDPCKLCEDNERKLISISKDKRSKSHGESNSSYNFNVSTTRENKGNFNWKSPWIIGIGIAIIASLIGLIFYFINRNKHDRRH